MGLFSDYLEKNRDAWPFDPCLVIHSSGETESTRKFYNDLTFYPNHDNTFSEQILFLSSEQAYVSAHKTLDMCLYREKQLLALKRNYKFSTYVVKDTIDEYLFLVKNGYNDAIEQLKRAKEQMGYIPKYIFDVEESPEDAVPITTLLNSLFYYLTSTIDFDTSHFLSDIFDDVSVLINMLEPVTSDMAAKDICKSYYEKTFHPTLGNQSCSNCGMPLFKEFPYCFNCFMRG